WDSEQGKETGRYEPSLDKFRFSISGQGYSRPSSASIIDSKFVEGPFLRPPRIEVLIEKAAVLRIFKVGEPNDPRGFLIGKRPQHDCLDGTENCGIRANGDSQNEDRHGSEPRVLAKHPHRVAKILHSGLQQRQASTVPVSLFCRFQASQADQSVAACYAWA